MDMILFIIVMKNIFVIIIVIIIKNQKVVLMINVAWNMIIQENVIVELKNIYVQKTVLENNVKESVN